MKNKAAIRTDYETCEVYVLDECGKEVFRRPRTTQNISIAHSVYMYHKYKDEAQRRSVRI